MIKRPQHQIRLRDSTDSTSSRKMSMYHVGAANSLSAPQLKDVRCLVAELVVGGEQSYPDSEAKGPNGQPTKFRMFALKWNENIDLHTKLLVLGSVPKMEEVDAETYETFKARILENVDITYSKLVTPSEVPPPVESAVAEPAESA